MSVTSKAAQPASVKKATIKSESGGSASLVNGFMQLYYYESLLQDAIFVDYMFVDSGNTVKGKSLMEGLPVHTSEEFKVEFEDNNNVSLKSDLIVNKVSTVELENAKTVVTFNLVTEEFLTNENTHVNKRMDGKISDHVKLILEDENYLATEKKLDIEETDNDFNFIPNKKKPYYTMNWLSTKGVPSKDGKKGDSAGFFLFETSKGYHFKSIDSLFAQKQKKKYIYTGSTDSGGVVPAGYDGKILEHKADNRINLQDKLKMGAFNTKIVRFDPFNCFYEEEEKSAKEAEAGTTTGGKNLPKISKKFADKSTRTTYMLVDKGVLPSGDNEEQIKKNEEETLDQKNVINQSIRRYNQMYSAMETITIAGDFSLHAGDAIWVDTPAVEKDHCGHEMNRENGGLYIISDLCHYVSSKETYTKMNIIRDSFGRKPKGR